MKFICMSFARGTNAVYAQCHKIYVYAMQSALTMEFAADLYKP